MVLNRNKVSRLILLTLCLCVLIGLGTVLIQLITQFVIAYPMPALLAVGLMALVWKAQDSEVY